MRKFFLYIMLLALYPLLIFAQVPDTAWTKTIGGSHDDRAYSIRQTMDGGFIITGYTESFGNSSPDVWLIKTDSLGDTLWTRSFGGYDDDCGCDVAQTIDSGYVIIGYTRSIGAGDYDIWLLCTNALGDTVWTKTFGSIYKDYGYSIKQLSDGGFIIAGAMFTPIAGGNNYCLIRTDPFGNALWTKMYHNEGSDYAHCVLATSDNGFAAIGYTDIEGGCSRAVWLIKTDNFGDTLWTKIYNPYVDWEMAYAGDYTQDEGYIITGVTYASGNRFDLFLLRTDANGDTLWRRLFGDPDMQYGYSVTQTHDGGFIAVGNTRPVSGGSSDFYTVKTDGAGNTLWIYGYGGTLNDEAQAVIQTSDLGYMIAGYTQSYGAGSYDAYLIKLEPDTLAITENYEESAFDHDFQTTIISGPLLLPKNHECRVLDISGRVVVPDNLKPGIYFVEIEGKIVNKVTKIK